MSKTHYSKKFIYTGLSFNKTNLSQEENENADFALTRKTKDSWKIFSKLQNIKNLKRPNSLQNMNNFLTPNNKSNSQNQNYVPINDKYSIIRFNKAPSLKENHQEINRMIKKRKLKKMEDLKNIFNNILINESKLFRSSLYITGGGIKNRKINNSKTIKFNRSQSHNDFMEKSKKYKDNSSLSIDNCNVNNESVYNSNSLYNESNFLSDNRKFNNRTQYPILSNSAKSISKMNIKLIEKDRLIFPMNNNEINKNAINGMRIEINNIIFKKLKGRRQFPELEKKMIKFKVWQNIQIKKLNEFMKKRKSFIDHKDKLINLKNLLEIKYNIYSEEMRKYLIFLFDKENEIKSELKIYKEKKKEINSELEKLILKLVKKQTELEPLVKKRNLLLQIKQRFKNPPSYYEELLIKDSKILLVGNSFLNLEVSKQIKNKKVISFIGSFLELKLKIEENKINNTDLKSDFSNNFIKDEKIDPIFPTVDDFIQLYNNLKEKSINYLKSIDIMNKNIYNLKNKYELNFKENNILEKEIDEKKKEREKIVNKNKILMSSYNLIRKNALKNKDDLIIKSHHKENKFSETRIFNIDNHLNEIYETEIKNYKYRGILLLKKLIEFLKYFSNFNYDNSDDYISIFKNINLKNALNIDIKEFNDQNISLINEYILVLVSKYEKVCKYILNKHRIYLLNEKNKEFIKLKKNEINFLKKKELSKKLKEIIKKKKLDDIKKIIDKSNKSIVIIKNNLNTDNKMKRNKVQKINNEKIMSYNKKNYLENEFNNLAKYSEEDM